MTNLEITRHITIGYDAIQSRESLRALAAVMVCRKYKKGERVLDEGEVCKCLRYIEKGMLRQFYFKNGKELTEHLAYEGNMVICLESYFRQTPSRLMIEALEPTTLWEIDKERVEELALTHADVGVWYRKVFEVSLIESQVKADTLRFEPANERYNTLMRLHPEIIKRVPLVYIAAYLQMTPETLSRVRSASVKSSAGEAG